VPKYQSNQLKMTKKMILRMMTLKAMMQRNLQATWLEESIHGDEVDEANTIEIEAKIIALNSCGARIMRKKRKKMKKMMRQPERMSVYQRELAGSDEAKTTPIVTVSMMKMKMMKTRVQF
jgi:hypothetical protein